MMWLNATISESYLPYVIGIGSARELWIALERRFAQLSRTHVLQLRSRLQSLRKGSSSITTYLQQIKEIADNLAAAGTPIQDLDSVFYILNGLPPEYDSFATSIRVREPVVNSDVLHSLLLTEELTINARSQLQLQSETSCLLHKL
ncbi:non-specific serine/threonine protein kinase [Ranunculus cassubicifolius]